MIYFSCEWSLNVYLKILKVLNLFQSFLYCKIITNNETNDLQIASLIIDFKILLRNERFILYHF